MRNPPFPEKESIPEEKELLRPTFACIPLYDQTTFLGILYIGFSKERKLSPKRPTSSS